FESLGNPCVTPANRCGTAFAEGGVRDTDWWGPITITEPTIVNWTLTSEFPGISFALEVSDCESVGAAPDAAISNNCEPGSASSCLPPGTWVIFVSVAASDGTPIGEGFPCGTRNNYTLSVSCEAGECTPPDTSNDECATAPVVT